MDKQLKKFLVHDVIWESFIKKDGTGISIYEGPQNLKGFINGKQKLILTSAGAQVISAQSILFDGDDQYVSTIKEQDKITRLDGRSFTVLQILPLNNEKGNLDCVEVYL